MKKLVFILIFITYLILGLNQTIVAGVNDIAHWIQQKDIKTDLFFLASSELQGREAGKIGGKTASLYIASQLYKNNLNPVVSKSSDEPFEVYYQNFNIIGVSDDQIKSIISIKNLKGGSKITIGKDYYYFFNSVNELDGIFEVVFAGYAIQAPEYHYNDLKKLDCRDKIVLAFYGEPLESEKGVFFNGIHRTHYSSSMLKARTLAQMGAKALILIPTPENRDKYAGFLQREFSRREEKRFILESEKSVPIFYLSADFSEKIFSSLLRDFEKEKNRLIKWIKESSKIPFSWGRSNSLMGKWQVLLKINDKEIRKCRNVLAKFEGCDVKLKNEYILIGTHYDHEGIKNGKVFRGADDNASGVAANLNIARAFKKLSQDEYPSRSIVFAFWDAEEKGTLGSNYFVQNTAIPLEKLKVVFNMDMIGRDASFNFAALRKPIIDEDAEKKVMIFYSAQVPALRSLAENVNTDLNLHLLFDPNVFFTSGSDHVNFHSKKIPIVYYFTGFHTDYSSPKDTPDKIDFNKLTRITKHIARFVYKLATMKEIPEFDSSILEAPEGDFRM